ncbi:hypothetical protein BpHYR1_030143 [Brachionus plicatilis]|uniref:Uncharacterized protein n=1 Tax=Brachionus plicatilis TaxID=10195 RepID=A0A3M7RMC9_BRAPC|nr:hypothetical protein BpHYR1_030143 [Brachionus plicatilis]
MELICYIGISLYGGSLYGGLTLTNTSSHKTKITLGIILMILFYLAKSQKARLIFNLSKIASVFE